MNFPAFNDTVIILKQVQGFEHLNTEYKDLVLLTFQTILVYLFWVNVFHSIYNNIYNANFTETSSYSWIRSLVIAYEKNTLLWIDKHILYLEIGVFAGAVTWYGNPGD